MTFALPLWALLGLLAAILSASMMVLAERFRLPGLAAAYWAKVGCAVIMVPFIFYFGVPSNPWFYLLVTIQAFLWVISDVVFFQALPKVGAAVVSRLLPAASVLTFLLWLLLDQDLWQKYLASPERSVLIFATFCGVAFFASRLRRCALSREAFRAIWFVFVAAILGPIMAKLVVGQLDIKQGPYAYVFFEALVMLACWSLWLLWRRPLPLAEVFNKATAARGLCLGVVTSAMVCLTVAAYFYVDNPAFIPAVKFLDAVFILGIYRILGKREDADIWSGLGIVACAAILVVLKAD